MFARGKVDWGKEGEVSQRCTWRSIKVRCAAWGISLIIMYYIQNVCYTSRLKYWQVLKIWDYMRLWKMDIICLTVVFLSYIILYALNTHRKRVIEKKNAFREGKYNSNTIGSQDPRWAALTPACSRQALHSTLQQMYHLKWLCWSHGPLYRLESNK